MKLAFRVVFFSFVISYSFAQIPTTGLVAYYPFNGNANDATENGRDGILHGAVLTTDRFGSANSAYSFNGTSDYISAVADGLPTTDRTVSFWFYANRVDNKPALFGYGGGPCGTSWIHSINTTGSGLMSLAGHCGINDLGYSYPSVPIGSWRHWVITTSASGTKMYVDDVLVQSNANYVTNTTVSSRDIIIGGCVAPSGTGTYTDGNVSFFDGSIDEIRIYSRELSSTEIHQMYIETLPVELISFYESNNGDHVNLYWRTATEVNNYGFEIEKTIKNDQLEIKNWGKIGFVEGNGTTNSSKEYFFTDGHDLIGKVAYRLKQIDRNGQFKYSQEVEVNIANVPKEFSLKQNYPNPFNPATNLEFTVANTGKTTLKIINTLGQEIATLFDGVAEAGLYHKATFNASKLASGIYFARLQSGDKIMLKKMVMMK